MNQNKMKKLLLIPFSINIIEMHRFKYFESLKNIQIPKKIMKNFNTPRALPKVRE